ncbi:hypothetical protein ANN_17602 [Periplaneta americana]|uniref:Odorant receptor n=1 Tax=Periplaneta americana TaxID=6978 RepID=A0ABQ8STD3_PERAM|nr:hypothetical protein ANN_17602 [Periplaneta americana]
MTELAAEGKERRRGQRRRRQTTIADVATPTKADRCKKQTSKYVLLCKIEPKISKKDTGWREEIPIQERLALTLRYLATRNSYTSLMYLFKVSKQLITRIVPEVCTAIIEELEDFIKLNIFPIGSQTSCFLTLLCFDILLGYVHVGATINDKSGSDVISERIEACIVIEHYCLRFCAEPGVNMAAAAENAVLGAMCLGLVGFYGSRYYYELEAQSDEWINVFSKDQLGMWKPAAQAAEWINFVLSKDQLDVWKPVMFFMLVVTTFLLNTLCVLLSCVLSFNTATFLSKTVYVSKHHSVYQPFLAQQAYCFTDKCLCRPTSYESVDTFNIAYRVLGKIVKPSWGCRFYEVLDNIVNFLDDRTDTFTADFLVKSENFLIGGLNDDNKEQEEILSFHGDDLDKQKLLLHRDMLLDIARSKLHHITDLQTVFDLFRKEAFLRDMLPELVSS